MLSEKTFIEFVLKVCGISHSELESLAGSTSVLETPLSRIHLDSLYLLELQLELEEELGVFFDSNLFIMTPSATSGDLFSAFSTP